ncbi:MAG: thioredoxin family protein [Chloroflexota bacterium]
MRNMADEEVTPACSWEETEKTIKEAGNIVLALFATAADAKCEACDYYDWVMTAVQEESPEAPLGALTLDLADPGCQEVAEKLGVTEYPTVVAFKGGKELKRLLPSLKPEEDLEALKSLCRELQ